MEKRAYLPPYSGQGIVNGNQFDAAAGTQTVVYTVTNADGCVGVDMAEFVINPLPEVYPRPPLAPLCASGDAVTLTASPDGGSFNGNGVSGGAFNPSVTGAGDFEVSYEFTDPATGCTNRATITITVEETPEVTITPVDPLCADADPFSFTASPPGGEFSGPRNL